jgi:dTDP-4-dehydrorhamnose reductase
MNILVTGANGQLGKEIQTICDNYSTDKDQFFFTDIDELNVTEPEPLNKFVKKNSISVIINCAAYTNVDQAEDEEKIAFLVNELAVKNLTATALENNVKIIHISTDYVFNGKNYKPYKETDAVNPVSIYGKSKLAGEQKIIETQTGIILRTSWLYSPFGKNFVKTIEKLAREREELKVVFDQVGSPTYAKDLAGTIMEIVFSPLSPKNYGVYHFSNEGVCSWYDLAKEIISLQNISCNIVPIESKDFPTKAPRPHYSVLNKSKIKRVFQIEIPHWKSSLEEMMRSIK